MTEYGFDSIPEIYSLNPLTMSKINGTNIFNTKLNIAEKTKVIDSLITSVTKLHSYETAEKIAGIWKKNTTKRQFQEYKVSDRQYHFQMMTTL